MARNKLKNRNKNQNDKRKQRATQAVEHTATSYSSSAASSSKIQPFDGTSTATAPLEKRDSVISSTWDDKKQEAEQHPTPLPQRRRWWRRLGRWWPCRIAGWIYHFFLAIARAYMGPQRADVLLTLGLLALYLFAGYCAIELVVRISRVVAAHNTDGSCSVVYVTVPGPIMTVSLIGATPSDPAHSTYYFSVVDGTTQWLDNMAPPSPPSTQKTGQTPSIPAISGPGSPSTALPVPPTVVTSSILATALPPSSFNSKLLGEDRELATRVIAYGDTSFRFIFPMPNVTTTVSYWTGVYPTVTGPLPSEFQTLQLTTRTKRQTPLSSLPLFEIYTSTQSRFQTIISTVPRQSAESGPLIARRSDVESTGLVQTTAAELTEITPTQTFNTVTEPEPTVCGESGNFTLTFDDTVVGGDNKILLVANGMKNPYHHLFYANGFTYVPDKWEPYPAVSQPNVAMFLPLAGRLLPNTPFAGTLLPGELGAGPRASVSAYWFNAYSAYFGCALSGLTPCTLRISGFRYDSVIKEEVLVVEQTATLPACWGYIKCRLTRVLFNEQFRALSGIQFNAYIYNLGIPQIHMMDDLQMEWFNNTCSAGILRIGHC